MKHLHEIPTNTVVEYTIIQSNLVNPTLFVSHSFTLDSKFPYCQWLRCHNKVKSSTRHNF